MTSRTNRVAHLGSVVLALWVVLFAHSRANGAESVERKQIADLENQLFDRKLTDQQLRHLLIELSRAPSRAGAARQLTEQGQGWQQRLVDYAAQTADLETRQALADIVMALDARYHSTDLGRQLGQLYRSQTTALLPQYWRRFRENPLDGPAVALLMHADAETVYAALKHTHDRRDPARFVLLRLREYGPNAFTSKHVKDHAATAYRRVLADVFPMARPLAGVGCHRVVGHVIVGQVRIREVDAPRSTATGLPQVQSLEFFDRRVCLFRMHAPTTSGATLVACWDVKGPRSTPENKVNPATASLGADRSQCEFVRGLECVPQLFLSQRQYHGWIQHASNDIRWSAKYFPEKYRPRSADADGESVRETAGLLAAPVIGPRDDVVKSAKVDPAAPSIVMLPPQLPLRASEVTATRAELLTERIAQELAADGTVQLVDRGQLAHVFKERELRSESQAPLLSYDAAVRINVSDDPLTPELRVAVIDLSTGNPLSSALSAWPPAENELATLLDATLSGTKRAGRAATGKTKVRTYGVVDVGADPRMRPLAERWQKLVEQGLARSDNLLRVEHLDAGSALEESLFLSMGLSRLPGGRQFAPAADATVELKVHAPRAVGQSFAESPVEIGVRVQRAVQDGKSWQTVSGRVREFDQLLPRAWAGLATQLQGIKPEAAAELLATADARRRQAEAELLAAKNIPRERTSEQQSQQRLAHCEAALKIDPTFDVAALERVRALGQLCSHNWSKYADTAYVYRITQSAAAYADQFDGQGPALRECLAESWTATRMTPLVHLYRNEDIALTPELRQMLADLRRLIDRSVTGGITNNPVEVLARMVPTVYRGMYLAGASPAQRQAWLESVVRQCDIQARQAPALPHGGGERFRNEHLRFRLAAARLLAEDGRFDSCQQMLVETRGRFNGQEYQSLGTDIREVALLLDEPALIKEFDNWGQRYTRTVPFMPLSWPDCRIFEGAAPQPKFTRCSAGRFVGVSGLVEGDGRLYVVQSRDGEAIGTSRFEAMVTSSAKQLVGYVPLDAEGRPRGKSDIATVENLPQPKLRKHLQVTCAQFFGGKLMLGTTEEGLLIFDPKPERWTAITPEQGLPAWRINSLFPLDADTLYCTAVETRTHYTVQLPSDAARPPIIKIVAQARAGEPGVVVDRLRNLWRHHGDWQGLASLGVCRGLLTAKPTLRILPTDGLYGWSYPRDNGITSAMELSGRRYFTCQDGLYEYDATGQELRRWGCQYDLSYERRPLDGMLHHIVVPADSPAGGRGVVAGSCLIFLTGNALVAYDPQADRWYGPVAGFGDHAIGTRSGIWLGMGMGLYFLSTDDLKTLATANGRALTTVEYAERREKFIGDAPPLVQAKFYFGLRKFDQALKQLDAALRLQPNEPDALLLQGYIRQQFHDVDLDQAAASYARLAQQPDASASLTGLYLGAQVRHQQGRWQDAAELCDQLIHTFPKMEEDARRNVDIWHRHCREELGKQADRK